MAKYTCFPRERTCCSYKVHQGQLWAYNPIVRGWAFPPHDLALPLWRDQWVEMESSGVEILLITKVICFPHHNSPLSMLCYHCGVCSISAANSYLDIHSKPPSTTPEFILMRGLWEVPRSPKDGGWLPGKRTLWLKGWNFQPQLPEFWEGREPGDLVLSPIANDAINCTSVMEASIKIQKDRVQTTSGWWAHGHSGRTACSERSWKLPL